MTTLDWIVLALFFLGLVAIVIWVMMQKEKDTNDYFLAGKDAGWISIGSSIFASNIGSEHLVGLAGAGFLTGMAMAHWEMHAWLILILGWVFVPFYDRIKVFTMPEYLERRFNPGSRSTLSFISLVSYILTKVTVTVYAGGVVFETVIGYVFGIDSIMGIPLFWFSALGLVIITGLYTVLGGMKAVMYTSVLQTPVLLIGSVVLLIIGLIKVGGWAEVEAIAGPNLKLIRPSVDPEFPWTGVLLGSAIIGFWYWCTDQFIVQRVLSGRNQREARRGAILAGYFKLTPVFIFLIPGIIAFALNQKGLLDVQSSDSAFASMVAQLLPTGMKGLVICGLLAALMSSLASLFNSSAMLFVEDFYKKMKKDASAKHYLMVGRIATTVVVVLGVLWIFVMKDLGKVLYEYLQSVQSLLAPGIASVFILGVFWKRTTGKAALWSLIVGFTAGMFRLILNIIYGAKVTLINEAEKYYQKLAVITEATKDQIISGIHGMNEKIDKVFSGEMADQYKSLIDNTTNLLSSGLNESTISEASNNLSSFKSIEQMFISNHGIFYQIASINWLHYCVMLFFFCICFIVIFSLLTKKPTEKQLQYVYSASTPEQRAETRASWNYWDIIHTVIILGIIVAFYIYFW